MVRFTAKMERYSIEQFKKPADKNAWTYVVVPADVVKQLNPVNRKIFRVKGKLDSFKIARVALMPMKSGDYFMAINKDMRKGTGKRHGAMLDIQLAIDKSEIPIPKDFIECLDDDPDAKEFFETLSKSHKGYFIKWIASAKTDQTKTKRLAATMNALARKWDYGQMLRALRDEKL